MKKILKTILSISSIIGLSAIITPIMISCSNSSKYNDFENVVDLKNNFCENKQFGQEQIYKKINSNDDLFFENIDKYANDDSILFYNIGQIAVSHKYVPIIHMLHVLEKNPNKEIYFFINKDNFSNSFYDTFFQNNVPIFPNLHFYSYNGGSVDFDDGYFEYGFEMVKIVNKVINENKIDKTKIVFTTDEFYFLNRLEVYTKGDMLNTNGFINDYLLFYEIRELNMVADGTGSVDFFQNTFFDYMFYNQEYFMLNSNNQYEYAIQFMKYFATLTHEQKIEYIKNNNVLNITQIFYYLFIASKNNNDSSFTRVNFYLPALEMVLDVNNNYSAILSHNDPYNLFFNPYNVDKLNLIKLLSTLNDESKELFYKTIGINDNQINDINSYESQFNNSLNIVYSGSKLDNEQTIANEARLLIKFYDNNISKNKNIKIWFKGHPRDSINYKQKLLDYIMLIRPEVANSIYFLNNTVPMEIYLGKPFMQNDEIQNRQVLFYGTFSTVILYLYCNKQQDNIQNILLSESNIKDINYFFGNKYNSILFNVNKVLEISEFLKK